MLVARIAEIKLSKEEPQILQNIYQMLNSLNEYFPETKNSLLEASTVPDLITDQYNEFLDFFHFANNPIIYRNDQESDFQDLPLEPYNITYAFQQATNIIKDSVNNKQGFIKNGLFDSLMLRYLIHITGDIHQPLHTATLYSMHKFNGTIRNGDRGGNLIKVYDVFRKQEANLHQIWDSAFGLYSDRYDKPLSDDSRSKLNIKAQNLMEKYPQEIFGEKSKYVDYNYWLKESYSIAYEFVYIDIDVFPLLRGEYIMKGREIISKQIALAGYRLAEYLKRLFANNNQ